MFSAAKIRKTGGKTLSSFAKLCFATVPKMRELLLLQNLAETAQKFNTSNFLHTC